MFETCEKTVFIDDVGALLEQYRQAIIEYMKIKEQIPVPDNFYSLTGHPGGPPERDSDGSDGEVHSESPIEPLLPLGTEGPPEPIFVT